jgi:hypothetical protein
MIIGNIKLIIMITTTPPVHKSTEDTKILGMSTLTLSLVAAGTATLIATALYQRAKTEKAKELFYYQ